ncbi:MAG: hypothetical protein DME84_10080 [Verrucomicrobia bacterium]|nr:MAG: hypothetical protein DME84_10080 [Verrucomicrobiota bacterium]
MNFPFLFRAFTVSFGKFWPTLHERFLAKRDFFDAPSLATNGNGHGRRPKKRGALHEKINTMNPTKESG